MQRYPIFLLLPPTQTTQHHLHITFSSQLTPPPSDHHPRALIL